MPLDPAYRRVAEERLKFVLHDSQASLVLTSSTLAVALGDADVELLVLDGETAQSIDMRPPATWSRRLKPKISPTFFTLRARPAAPRA